jgi:hypothetical protein
MRYGYLQQKRNTVNTLQDVRYSPTLRTMAGYSVQIVDYAQRVREICAQLSTARDSEWQPLLEELREVLREHDRWVRIVAAATLKNSIDSAA